MDRKDIEVSIRSYRNRLKGRKEDAVTALREGSYWAAQIAISECVAFDAVINELDFQLACMGEEDDDQD